MLIKPAQDRARDLESLDHLASTAGLTPTVVARIRQETRNIRAGQKGEAEAAYEIDFHHKASRNWAVIHDLRLDFQGRVAQIDHLLINRFLDIWVCESKHFSEGVSINDVGEFTAFHGSRPYGVPSPLEQNKKHVAVLQAALGSSIVRLQTRMGIVLTPRLQSVVLVSKGARITRPKIKVDGLDQVIKTDQLRSLVERNIEQVSVASLLSATKLVSSETLESFAQQIAGLHRPITFNWAAKFGIADRAARPAMAAPPSDTPSHAMGQQCAGLAQAPAPPPYCPPTPAAATGRSAPIASGRDSSDGSDKLSTSKLAAKHGIKTAGQMLERLTELGYLEPQGDQWRLTSRGIVAGGVFIEKSRFGPYFVWPADLPLGRLADRS